MPFRRLLSPLRHAWLALAVAIAAAAAAPAAASPAAEPLVSVGWLKQNLARPELLVLDVRSALDGGGEEAYRRGHIPGAVHSDYDKAGWRVTRDGVPFMLPTLAQLEKLIGEIGIDEDRHVVVVPAGVHVLDFGAAARVYWTLKAAGHSRVSILDGGYAAWTADPANPVETGFNRPSPAIFSVSLNKGMLVGAAEVETVSKSGAATLLDARSPALYSGKERAFPATAYGHIPGAVNIDSAAFYDPAANRLRPRAELASVAASLPAGKPVISYCNTGHWAATNWFVLSELLGRKEARLYAGSMVEWTADPARPVASSRTRWDDIKKTLGFGL